MPRIEQAKQNKELLASFEYYLLKKKEIKETNYHKKYQNKDKNL